ncbi:hypothetical protein BH14310 [Bartonella henselae str. Houston-1]|uniref:Uncharacterized protein n=2 Tax=root TaxID=1 RepID=A0A0H3LXV9_BARHE|nr:hypothetical protein BH14310 [Bartonella henselae str. Houston-1]DBA12277.1 TPA_asm: hypothetical protein [Bartonegtaviriform andersoni]
MFEHRGTILKTPHTLAFDAQGKTQNSSATSQEHLQALPIKVFCQNTSSDTALAISLHHLFKNNILEPFFQSIPPQTALTPPQCPQNRSSSRSSFPKTSSHLISAPLDAHKVLLIRKLFSAL